jgi:hypothetical protein
MLPVEKFSQQQSCLLVSEPSETPTLLHIDNRRLLASS